MTDLYYLSQADGVGEWRVKEAKDLSDLVQNRITYLQVSTGLPAAQPAGVRSPLTLTHARRHNSLASHAHSPHPRVCGCACVSLGHISDSLVSFAASISCHTVSSRSR